MKVFPDLSSIVSEIALRKRRVAEVRFGRTKSAGPPPRDVFVEVAERIGQTLAVRGFRFARSGPHASRKVGDLVHYVGFQSSRSNIAGEYVAMWVFANVRSSGFARWLATWSHGTLSSSVIAGGQLGNLRSPQAWLEWNLADASLDESVESVVASLEQTAIPFFGAFESSKQAGQALEASDLPGMDVESAIEFSIFAGAKGSAQATLNRFFAARKDLLDSYQEALRSYRRCGPLPHGRVKGGYATNLALATLRFGLQPPRPAI